MDTPKYGKVTDGRVLDAHGSVLKEESNYRAGTLSYPIRRDYEYRHPTDKTDIERIAQIAKDLLADETKLDSCLRFETRNSNGKKSFYVVECYTKLVY